MSKLLLSFVLSLIFLVSHVHLSYAATIYSNDFRHDISDFILFYDSCSTSTNGLNCNGTAGITKMSYLNTKCVSFDASNTDGIPQVILSDNALDERMFASFLSGTTIQVYLIEHSGETHWDTEVAVPNGLHNLQFCEETNRISVYIDQMLVWEQNVNFPHFDHAGFYVDNGTTLTNFIATDTLPVQHNVPLFKQGVAPYTNGDPVWEGEEFDHANVGQFRCGKTMAQCGCSTTSIAMVLKHHGIDRLPDGSALTPGTLNTWLKNNNGYNRNAGVIWGVAAAMTKKAKSKNPQFQYDALEYSRGNADQTKLRTDLENNIPNILEVPGHFIVGTGIDGNTFTINDPYYARTSLTVYNNTYLSTRRYVPSHTDVSYITLYVDPDVDIKLTDSTGNTLGEEEIEYEVNDPTSTQTPSTPLPSLKVISYAKPATETYKITVSSTNLKQYQIDVSVIDQEGDNTQLTFEGFVDKNAQNTFTLNYNKQTVNITAFQKNVTFESTSADIQEAEKLKQLNKVLGLALKTSLETAQKQLPKNKKLAVKLLETGKKLLEESRRYGQLISKDAYEVIHYDFVTLINKYK